MDKTQLFMVITAMVSFIYCHFNKILDYVISEASKNIYDAAIVPLGIHYRSLPLSVKLAMIDGQSYTNKFELMLMWKWDFDIKGFTSDNIQLLKPDAKRLVLQAHPKYGASMKEYAIDLVEESITITDDKGQIVHDILFGEICLFPDR